MADSIHAIARLPDSANDIASLTARARLATAQARWTEAAQLWAELHVLTPMHIQPPLELARALVSQNDPAAAARVLDIACAANAENFDLAAARADIASRSQDWEQAEVHWRAVYERFPDHMRSVLGLADALSQLKHYERAETVLATALLSEPDHQAAAEALARVSARRGDWTEAYRRWSVIIRRFPTSIAGWHGAAYARLKQGDVAGAEALSLQAVALFPDERVVLIVHAIAAASGFDWPAAEQRWDRVRRLAPNHADVWVQQARALRAQGRDEAAAALLAEAPPFPGNQPFAMMQAELAGSRGQWADACMRGHQLAVSSPADRRLQVAAFVSAWRAAGSVSAQPALAQLSTAAFPRDEERDLLLRFEGLGDDGEFGFVQRHFRAEPLGLFRWADIATGQLVTALEAGLEGIGEIKNTKLVAGGDYKVRDRRFGLTMHTWVTEDQADRQQFFEAQCRRLKFLRRNFMEDLQEADKIFIYKSASFDAVEEVRQLHAAIRRHGPSRLLYVRAADEAHAGGSVEQVDAGLFIGYLDRIYDGRAGAAISYDCWFTLCRTALVMAGVLDARAAQALTLRDLVLRFESVGSNCEFGCVQRYARAEPIGLFRWTATTLASITKAIDIGLSGIGDAAHTELVTGGHYRALDSTFGFGMPTFLGGDQGDGRDLLVEQCERMRFLRIQVLADLKAARRIFVHKTATPPHHDDIISLHAAMRRHGTAILLHVRPGDMDHPNGTVSALAPGLLAGYIDRVTAAGDGWGIDHATWLEVCRKTVAICD